MFGVDLATAGSLMVLAAAGGGDLCAMPHPTELTVSPQSNEVSFDYSKTIAEMQAYQIDTVDPHGFGEGGISVTQGLMNGSIKLTPNVVLGIRQNAQTGQTCMWYDKVTVTLEIDPNILIAKEVAADPCMRAAVIEHELKHVTVDRKIVNKYADIMGQRLYSELKDRGFVSSPVPQEYAKALQGRMQQTVYQIVGHEYKKMELERMDLQRDVDSRAEYERVQAVCPDFHVPEASVTRAALKGPANP